MELAQVDQWATGGASAWHRASAPGKLIGTALLIATVVTANDWRVLAAVYLAILIAVVMARLPALKIALIGAYPALFTLIFALSQSGGWNVILLILARALTAALAMLLLITTTPYVDIFAALGSVMPALIAGSLRGVAHERPDILVTPHAGPMLRQHRPAERIPLTEPLDLEPRRLKPQVQPAHAAKQTAHRQRPTHRPAIYNSTPFAVNSRSTRPYSLDQSHRHREAFFTPFVAPGAS